MQKPFSIIDMRVRPPYKSFMDCHLYQNVHKPSVLNRQSRMGWNVPPSSIDRSMESFIKEMDEAGITKCVAPVRKVTNGVNDDVVSLVNEYPDRFIGIIDVHPKDGDAAIEEIERYVVDGNCTGITMELGCRHVKEKMYVDDKSVYPIYEYCQNNRIPLILMYGGGSSWEYYPMSALEQVCIDFPELTIISSHGGWPRVRDMCHLATRFPNVYISTDFYLVDYFCSQDYVTAANYILQDQIIFGTAYPIISFQDAIDGYLRSGIRQEILPKVMYSNAARALGLEK